MFSGYTETFPYSYVTDKLIMGFPRWTKIRKDPNSIGRQFLNVFGLILQEIEEFLDEALKNQYIGTANLGEIAYIYKTQLSFVDRDRMPSVILGDSAPLRECYSLMEFYSASETDDVCIIDYDQRLLYTRKKYNSISFGETTYTDIRPHHVWNVFDEFGLLLGLRRRYLESNAEFKERILDVFRFPGNSTRLGLIRAIGRELGLVKRLEWPEATGSDPFVIIDDAIIPETLIVNGKSLHPFQYETIGNECRIYPRVKVFYRDDFKYRLDNVRFTYDKKLVLADGVKEGFLITPVINVPNLKLWNTISSTSSGNVKIEILRYDFDSYTDQSQAYIKDPISSVSEPVRLLITLSRASKFDPSPELDNVILTYLPSTSNVAYIYGVMLNALHDDAFRSSLFEPDGSPSDKLKNYVSELNDLVPIMWGRWKWDEAYWDVVSKDLMGLQVLPNKWDPRLGEISNAYFQSGVGYDLDLFTRFTDDSWTPQIHSGYYYITSSETVTSDGSGVIKLRYPSPSFVDVKDSQGRSYRVVEADRNVLHLDPVPPANTTLEVLYSSENYLYAQPKTHTVAGPTSSFTLPDAPLQGAPVIIEAVNTEGKDVILKQVAFLNAEGQLSIENTETIVGAGSNIIYLTYGEAFDVFVEGHTVQSINDNAVVLVEPIPQQQSVVVRYKVKDSFIVSGQDVTLSGQYSNIRAHYESAESTAYFNSSGPSFDPVLSHVTEGFLYLTNNIDPPAYLDIKVHPDVIKGNALDSCIVIVDVLDRWGNPVLNQDLSYSIRLTLDENSSEITPPGSLVLTGSYYNRKVYRYVSPDPSILPNSTEEGRKKPCTSTITFTCGSIQGSACVKVR